MNLQQRIDLMAALGVYMESDAADWQAAKEKASQQNGWFIPDFIHIAVTNICRELLQKPLLENFCRSYNVPDEQAAPKTVGVVMAGNIPLVGFHDFLCVFLSGHRQKIKLSEKDNVLLKHLVEYLITQQPALADWVQFADMLKACDAYIATGGNNSGRYFDYYFGRYPHIIRRNKTSAGVLTGHETAAELELLAHDIHQYFGLGCRNITQLLVPAGYNFVPLLDAFKAYTWMADHFKYKNNYDYNLALYLLNKQFYMTNGSILLVESDKVFAPLSQLNYSFYSSEAEKNSFLQEKSPDIQCIVGEGFMPFGAAQRPGLADFADGVDTMRFLVNLT